ncbi:MAG: quinolinate synthase NadA [Deltaproteobacteria bacterium]|jgi:quinolinate synthase|nr:quinolinate synthase NadA [Deltaproteobacteria bacterium]
MLTEKKRSQMARIQELAKDLDVEILAHFYQRPEIKALASFVGGSRGIYRWAKKTKAQTILLCGVSFMAETIERLRPDLNILVPRQDAGCPYSQTVTANSIWEIRRRDPKALIIADSKAPGSVKDLADVMMPIDIAPGYWNNKTNNRHLYILPGQNLMAHDEVTSRLIEAVCQVHWQVGIEAVAKAKQERPDALVVVNVLCNDEVKARADKVGDSQAIWDFCADNPHREYIVVAEAGLTESMALTWGHKRFYDPGVEIFCPNMKLTNLRDLLATLESYQFRAGLITRFGARSMGGQLSHDIPG